MEYFKQFGDHSISNIEIWSNIPVKNVSPCNMKYMIIISYTALNGFLYNCLFDATKDIKRNCRIRMINTYMFSSIVDIYHFPRMGKIR